jgi:glycerol kinase
LTEQVQKTIRVILKTGKHILAIDQGTSSTKTLVFNEQGKVVAKASEPLKTNYLDDGFVEQDAEEIYQNVLLSVKNCLDNYVQADGSLEDIKAIGISNQRETFVVWNDKGKPLCPAVVWQCKRSVNICHQLKQNGLEPTIKTKTGLIIDPYFSATKLTWLKQNSNAVAKAIEEGNAYFGTIDTWLLYKLSKGKNYFTDYTNASRTLLFNLHTLQWDEELINAFGLNGINLPVCKPSSSSFGDTDLNGLLSDAITIASMIGDSHAAAFGEGCFEPGTAKATMGTGCSILMNIGSEPKESERGMVTTICWSTDDRIDYAFEGIIVSCGATIEWLKNELGLIGDNNECVAMAEKVVDNNGVYLIPAFSGLGSPHWDMNRKASITGLSFDCNKNHIVRAALESIAYQVKDVIEAMEQDAAIELKELMADGGITSNKFVLQFLADLLGRKVATIGLPDVSALGAAYLAGLQTGIFKTMDDLKKLNIERTVIDPGNNKRMNDFYKGWKNAISSGKTGTEVLVKNF